MGSSKNWFHVKSKPQEFFKFFTLCVCLIILLVMFFCPRLLVPAAGLPLDLFVIALAVVADFRRFGVWAAIGGCWLFDKVVEFLPFFKKCSKLPGGAECLRFLILFWFDELFALVNNLSWFLGRRFDDLFVNATCWWCECSLAVRPTQRKLLPVGGLPPIEVSKSRFFSWFLFSLFFSITCSSLCSIGGGFSSVSKLQYRKSKQSF